MFTTPKTNVIVSDLGFSIELLGRTGIFPEPKSQT